MSDLSLMNQKIPATSIPKMVADLIQFELGKTGSLNSTSLAYWGADITFKIELNLYARGKEELVIGGVRTIGEPQGVVELPLTITEGSKRIGMTGKPNSVKGRP